MSTLYQPETEERIHEYLVWAVKLRPTLLARIRGAREDRTIQRIAPKKFRDVLAKEGWGKRWRDMQLAAAEKAGTRQKGEKIALEKFDPDCWWRYGSEVLFGKEGSARILRDSIGPPAETGVLPCGCAPTMELLRGDRELVPYLLYLFNQLCLLHWLVNILSDTVLTKCNITMLKDDCGTHHVLDFTNTNERRSFIGALVQAVALGPTGKVDENGWPKCSSPSDTSWDSPRKVWLHNLREILVHADPDDMAAIDQELKDDPQWIPTSELKANKGRADTMSDDERVLDALEEHLMLRYWLTSFKRGQVPVEFLAPPTGTSDKPLCRKCRGVAMTSQKVIPENLGMSDAFQNQGNDFVDDGYSDEDEESEEKHKSVDKAVDKDMDDLSDEEVDEEDCL